MEEYVFFWQNKSPFSQWHKATFTVSGVTFTSAEQYMMYNKAMMMGDEVIAEEVLATNNPKEQKALGRRVSNFDAAKWDKHCKQIVFEGNLAKFQQNPSMMKELEKTKGKILVEASPYDRIWGIGLGPDHPDRFDKSKWKGKNYLGYVLTDVRKYLIKE